MVSTISIPDFSPITNGGHANNRCHTSQSAYLWGVSNRSGRDCDFSFSGDSGIGIFSISAKGALKAGLLADMFWQFCWGGDVHLFCDGASELVWVRQSVKGIAIAKVCDDAHCDGAVRADGRGTLNYSGGGITHRSFRGDVCANASSATTHLRRHGRGHGDWRQQSRSRHVEGH